MLIFLSSPYTALSEQIEAELVRRGMSPKDIHARQAVADSIQHDRYLQAMQAATDLQCAGNGKLAVISRAALTHSMVLHHGCPCVWHYWESNYYKLLDMCDLMVVLEIEGYRTSHGIKDELAYELRKGREPVHWPPDLLTPAELAAVLLGTEYREQAAA